MFVTTSYHPTPAEYELAEQLARRLDCRLVRRGQSSLPRLQRTYGEQDIVVATTKGLRFFAVGSAEPLYFHPSSGQVRLKRLLHGEPDALLETAGVRPGDRVLDCTAGLGSESILFSYAAGPEGAVTALESERLIAIMLEHGLAVYESGLAVLDEAMRRIQVVHAEHLSYLRQQPDNSFDIVYFDPMFRETIDETSAIAPLKRFANYEPLTQEAIREAKRVASRSVVLKEHRESGEFERLGFEKRFRPHTKIAYGVIHT